MNAEENEIVHEIFRVVSRYLDPRYISCYISENWDSAWAIIHGWFYRRGTEVFFMQYFNFIGKTAATARVGSVQDLVDDNYIGWFRNIGSYHPVRWVYYTGSWTMFNIYNIYKSTYNYLCFFDGNMADNWLATHAAEVLAVSGSNLVTFHSESMSRCLSLP